MRATRAKVRLIKEVNATGERYKVFEIELPWPPVVLLITYPTVWPESWPK